MIVIYLLFALDMLNLSMFITIFGRHVVELGGSHLIMGVLGSCTALTSLVWKPVAGSLSDIKGKKTILMWCLVLSLIGNCGTCLFPSLYVIFIARILCAFGSPVQIILRTIIQEMPLPNETKMDIFNKLGIIFALCFMSGSLISGYISEFQNGIEYVYYLMSANILTSIVSVKLLQNDVKPIKTDGTTAAESAPKNLVDAFNNMKKVDWSKYWDIFTIKGSIELTGGIVYSNVGYMLVTVFNVSGRYMGYIFTVISVCTIIANLVMLKLNKTVYLKDKGYVRTLHGTCLLILSYLGLGISSGFNTFICFIAIMSMARALVDAAVNELILSKITDEDKSIVNSSLDSTFSLSELFTPILSSILVEVYGERFALFSCIVPTLLITIIASRQKTHTE